MAGPLLLLVDDAPEIAQIVRHLARRAGQEVVCRADAASAWACLRDASAPRPDLVLLDVNLPGVSGLDFYRQLQREWVDLAGLPVALFVQWSLPALIAEGLAAGIDFVVAKDLLARPDGWKERIDEVLDLAGCPPTFAPGRGGKAAANTPGRLAAVQQALHHPALRLDEEVVGALWSRALARVVPEEAARVDVWKEPAKLTQTLAPLAATRPDFLADLTRALVYQVECLLGRRGSEALRSVLAGPS